VRYVLSLSNIPLLLQSLVIDLWICYNLGRKNPGVAGQRWNSPTQETKRSRYQNYVCKFVIDDEHLCEKLREELNLS
jgi:hypothetical protein